MRIICPNCDAQYEVPASVIPEEGRDVECSNCGKTWYQYHPDHPPAEPDPAGADTGGPAEAAAPDTRASARPEAESTAPEQPDPAHTPPEPSVPERPVPARPSDDTVTPDRPARRRELDPGVADILREEAAREQAARAAEAEGLEVQTDLNLEPALPPTRTPTAEPPAAPIPQEPHSAPPLTNPPNPLREPTSRRELLPDIEEINSTLRSTGDRDAAGDDPAPDAPIRGRQKRSFRRGFVISVALVAVGALLYVFAPQISASLPQAEPILTPYIAAVDDARFWLTGQMAQLTEWLAATAAATGQ